MTLEDYYVVNDALLVKPAAEQEKTTEAGIIIPKIVITSGNDKAPPKILRGFVIKTGGGYPIGQDTDMTGGSTPLYIPLIVKPGHEVFFLETAQYVQILLEGEVYYLLRQGMILVGREHED